MIDYPSHLYTNESKGTAWSKKRYDCKWIWYPALHVDTNKSKGTAWSKKGYRCKWTW
jgi:hypothetical protein